MTDVMYEIPSDSEISEVKITRECVLGNAKPQLIKRAPDPQRNGRAPRRHPRAAGHTANR